MGGRGGPPDGPPEGVPGGDDEFRSVVFDESFIRAARLQELSAQERLSSASRPVRDRRTPRSGGSLPRQALALMLLIAMAFAAAVYMGIRHPYRETVNGGIELSMSVIPLQAGPRGVPTGHAGGGSSAAAGAASVPATPTGSASASGSASAVSSASGSASPSASASKRRQKVSPDDPFYGTTVQDYPIGSAGITLPNPDPTAHFSGDQVLRALDAVQQYLVDSSLEPAVVNSAGPSPQRDEIRSLLDTNEAQQFDRSLAQPRNDRRHEATGWLVRFDPAKVRLASPETRVSGAFHVREADADTLEITSDHTFVYALRQLDRAQPVVLFTVRRELVYRFTHADVQASRIEIADSVTQAGPMACDADPSAFLQPVFPGAAPSAGPSPSAAGAGVDPFDHTRPAWQVCGVLSGPTL